MSVSWDYYRKRNRITNLPQWRSQNNIESYTDFLKVLRSLSLDPVPPTHPDLVLMEITGGDEARKILEEKKRLQLEAEFGQTMPYHSKSLAGKKTSKLRETVVVQCFFRYRRFGRFGHFCSVLGAPGASRGVLAPETPLESNVSF